MKDLFEKIKLLTESYQNLSDKYCETMEILLELHRCYPYIFTEIVTEEKLNEILGDNNGK